MWFVLSYSMDKKEGLRDKMTEMYISWFTNCIRCKKKLSMDKPTVCCGLVYNHKANEPLTEAEQLLVDEYHSELGIR